jgi:2-polyprenyl-6-methoxyphenol hydroxylase-like FAD-dependent oxidoreductase
VNASERGRIAIVGGGPGGLTLARLLQMHGRDVVVYERDADPYGRGNRGATLDLHESGGLEALRRAGLMDAFRAAYRPGADRLVFVDREGTTIFDEFASADVGEERPEIDRGPLRTLLLDSLSLGTVRWGHKFNALTRRDDGNELHFANGANASAGLVVAADGAHSALRPYVTDERPVYCGITVIEGNVPRAIETVPAIARIVRIGKLCALADSKTIFAGAKGDGSLSFYTGHSANEDWSRTCGIDFANNRDVLDWFHAEFAGWSAMWDALFDRAEPNLMPRPQYYCSPNQTWTSLPNLTLLGDAAHLMPPYAGEGVNMAMQDAFELAELLLDGKAGDAASAIAAYERLMFARASASTRTTLENTYAFHSPGAMEHFVAMFQSFAAARQSSSGH